ncbi:hypothetical protein CR162_17265 [Pseudoroseomonas rhizosphaerae]|uniref:Uncharacterized protein n=1 Tax=Teichococcus rhizosphaerae TaxID=1335062 RepID=A0A2C7A8Q2_9PROT|nr:hypothetical protein [Pseudoroseomonas rhizosphaerae]PHK93735.1 hypothetical protein CR162_17265 [Pseudoroseomonas rhizosphaerae]
MLDGRLLGPLLLATGSTGLLMPDLPLGWLAPQDTALIGLALISLGAGLALAGWRSDLADASFQGYAALRQMIRGARPGGPARRMKIRIRCAR